VGLYNVVAPCVVGELHYTRRSAKPVEVDDKLAAPLVETGQLESVCVDSETDTVLDGIVRTVPADEPLSDVDGPVTGSAADDPPSGRRAARRRPDVESE
jgi:hypothetical protein